MPTGRQTVDAATQVAVRELADVIEQQEGPLWPWLPVGSGSASQRVAPLAPRRPSFAASVARAWRDLRALCTGAPRKLRPEQRARRDQVRAAAKKGF